MRLVVFALLLLYSQSQGVVSVTNFGPLKLGGVSPYKAGDSTSYPTIKIPNAEFYVYVVAKDIPVMCAARSCGIFSDLVVRMGGWITGDDQPEHCLAVGLEEEEVWQGKSSVVVIANRNSRIIGIYPNSKTQNLPEILRRHPELGTVPIT
jgi:hypothetical protein